MVVGHILRLLSKAQHFIFLGWTMTFWGKINLVELEDWVCFGFEGVFILSPSLTQGEKEDLFKVVIVTIKYVKKKRVLFSIQVHAYTVNFKTKVHFSLPPPCACVFISNFKPSNILCF